MEPVLLVDDDPSARACLREFLELKGYQCIEADHGEAALEKIAKEGRLDRSDGLPDARDEWASVATTTSPEPHDGRHSRHFGDRRING